MEKLQTLSDFIEEQITSFELSDTNKIKNKLRTKFTRTLKELDFWDNAKTQIFGRNKTKVFTQSQLNQLYEQEKNYLTKLSNIDQKNFEEFKKEYHDYLDNRIDYQEKEISEEEYERSHIKKVSDIDKMQIMIEAIFNRHFVLDEQKWNQDLETEFYASAVDNLDDPRAYIALERLKNPLKSYVKLKDEK